MPSVDDGYGNARTSRGGSTSGPKSRGGRQRQQRQQQQNNNQNQGQGDGRAAAQAAHAARLNAAEAQRVATAKNAATLNEIESQRVAEQKAENQRAAKAAEKEASKARNKEDIVSARDRRERVPVGSAWAKGSPNERSRDPLERLDRSSGRGMQNQGDAFYPTGFAESLEDNLPTGFSRGLFGSPMAAAASTVGKTFYNQHQYGMNKEAADLYKELIADPANEGKTVQELVQMARQPQKDKQKSNAFIHDETGSTATEAQLNAMRPFIKDLNMSKDQWDGLPIEMKRQLARNVNSNNLTVGSANQGDGGGGLLGGTMSSVEPAAEESTYTNLDSYLKLFGNNTY